MTITYRFRGATPPEAGARASVLSNSVPVSTSAPAEPGVAVLRLYDPIDDWGGDWGVSAKEFAAGLALLPADIHTIRLHLNSPGGLIFEALAILNQLRQHPARVVAIVDGLAASAASFVACGVDELVMAPNSQLMIHDGWGMCIGNAADMRKTGDLLDRLSDNIAAIYAEKSGGSVADWRTAMLAESWYSPEEAVAAGLADSMLDVAAEGDLAAADSIDLSAVGAKYSGRDDAPAPLITISARRRLDSRQRTPRGL